MTNSAFAATEFVCTINKSGEDYNTLSLWESAMDDAGDITAANCKVFSHGGITGSIADGASVTGVTSGATATVIHATSTQILLDSISGTFQSGEQIRVNVSNYVTSSNTGDSSIIVAHCYNDDGDLSESLYINGTTTGASNYIKITVPESDRHNGTEGTGFCIDGASPGGRYSAIIAIDDPYTIIEWVEIKCTTADIYGIGAIFFGEGTSDESTARYCIIHDIDFIYNSDAIGIKSWYSNDIYVYNNMLYDLTGGEENGGVRGILAHNTNLRIYNNTVHGMSLYGIRESSGSYITAKNNIVSDGAGVNFSGTFANSDYNYSDDATSTGGANDIETDTSGWDDVTYANEGSRDLHLGASGGADLGPWGNGVDLSGTLTDDIDGDTRSSWDIGADEYTSGAPPATPTLNFGVSVTQI